MTRATLRAQHLRGISLHRGNDSAFPRYGAVPAFRYGRLWTRAAQGALSQLPPQLPIPCANTTLGEGEATSTAGSAVISSSNSFSGTDPTSVASRVSSS